MFYAWFVILNSSASRRPLFNENQVVYSKKVAFVQKSNNTITR
jgi:hypothetical protein